MRLCTLLGLLVQVTAVKELFTAKEFKDLMAEANGRPIILDFYSRLLRLWLLSYWITYSLLLIADQTSCSLKDKMTHHIAML